ncbi:MAG: NAD(P)-dependent oxidoreductase [Hyphomonadaceae bacterium]|nr:NAD(P)-dependent oxidoreductase [Hyphomonadaceae bacterium]
MSEARSAAPRCLLTGASGYVGSLIAAKLAAEGWAVTAMTRAPKPGQVQLQLGEPVSADALRGADALIHCAYDFQAVEWNDIHAVNVEGSKRLFEAARAAGVKRVVLISTISAFDGCRSKYGRAKLKIETAASALGARILRPGLIYGLSPGGMFGRLVAQVRTSRFVPMPGDGRQIQFTLHEDDLTDGVYRALSAENVTAAPVTLAHHAPHTFRDIIEAIGARLGRKVVPVPTPWQAMWLALRAAELARLPTRLRSDSLISLMHQNQAPLFNAEAELGVRCRSFDLSTLAL